ncbi:MAG: PTS sugar transporter subunit IIA [Tractidigestivibacter sp.]|jgi:PTS system N-acetylgalactosamine-specific IIA component|uniref:PTS sugar transporter subunit IIA n=1 Tax=Tractidigestivibacter sp. TaxID=2847320 RepID=UPI003D8F9B75
MVGFVLTGHGMFAPGLASAASMIAGQLDEFDVVPFKEEEAGGYPEKIASVIADSAKRNEGVIVLCDLMGGTPFNQSMMASQNCENVEVVAGANLPMLLEVLSTRAPESTVDELVECCLEAGKMGVAHVALDEDDASEDEGEEDGI